jgi:hypothetical protein
MNPFQKEVFIRLSDDGSSFACRTRYGRVYSKTTEFVIDWRTQPDAVEEALVPVNKRSGRGIHEGRTAERRSDGRQHS